MTDFNTFFSVFIIPFGSNASIKPKENIYFTHKQKHFLQRLLANKRIKLRGSKFGREELWVSSPTISDEINLRSKHDLIYHVAKVEATASAHSMVDVIPT